jgi:hypothetical protein
MVNELMEDWKNGMMEGWVINRYRDELLINRCQDDLLI